ncbi:MAG: chloride channel protein [Chloroflexota bacterium]
MHRSWLLAGVALAVPVGVAAGLASAAFLAALAAVTAYRESHGWLIFLLPAAGALMAWAYATVGRSAAGGNNLILDQIHGGRDDLVPLRMFPLILASTLLTHLVGGSAGREGTAVQMGGAIAAAAGRRLGLTAEHLRVLLMCGVSGGFAGVFGTPLAGAVFGMEVLALGGFRYGAMLPCLAAAVSADLTVRLLGIPHAHYAIATPAPPAGIAPVLLVAVAGVAFGLCSALFIESVALVERMARRFAPDPVRRAALGGAAVLALTLALGTRAYNGLSLPLLASTFDGGAVPALAFLFKLILTAVTLGVGFKGGEVTPLFVIGATLGVTLAAFIPLEPDFLAALGFIAVFAAAANAPVACVIMGAELFGNGAILYGGIAVFVAYTVSGHRGIYHAQRILAPKFGPGRDGLAGAALRDLRERPERPER